MTLTVIGGVFLGTTYIDQQLFPAGIALSAPGGSTDELYIDLSGSLPGGQNSLYAPNGTSLRQLNPPPGDGLTSADAEGGGGGVGSFNTPNATVNNNPTTKAYDAATSINAGGDVNITATTKVKDSATAQNGSGGLIAASDVQATINIGGAAAATAATTTPSSAATSARTRSPVTAARSRSTEAVSPSRPVATSRSRRRASRTPTTRHPAAAEASATARWPSRTPPCTTTPRQWSARTRRSRARPSG